MVDWQLRLRAVLETQFTIILGVLLVLALLGGWMTYTAHAAPEPTTEQQVTAWEVTGNFTHSATVEAENSLYEQGRTLTDRPAYFLRLSPELDGTFSTSYDVRDSGNLTQTVSLSLVMRNVGQGGQDDEQTVYWQRTDQLDSVTVEAVDPGERVSVPFSRNMSAAEAERERIRTELGGSPGETRVQIRAAVHSRGTINGERVNETDTFALPVSFDGGSYSVTGPTPTVESYEATQSVAATRTTGPLRNVGGPLLLLVSLGLLGMLTVSDTRRLSEAEQALLAYEDDRETFDEWISTIKLPDEAFDLPQAEADSLGELVDFAIDTDNGVIQDPDEEIYYVRHDGYLYTYRPSQEMTASSTEDTTTSDDPDRSDAESTHNDSE